jgi:type IV pilus assembly protein PilC
MSDDPCRQKERFVMPAYKCKIASIDGEMVEKFMQASSMTSLKKQVAKEGGFLVAAKKTINGSASISFFNRQKLKAKEVYSFNQEFLTLLRAGLPVVIALDGIIEKQEKSFFSKVLNSIRDDISSGESISTAFEKYETLFSSLYIAILRSGEASGNIPDAIEEYLAYFERALQIRQKIKSASVYPLILVFCSVFVVLFLVIFVVPTITGTLVEAGSQLPLFTRILLGVSDGVRSYFWAGAGGFLLMISGVSYGLKNDGVKFNFDKFYLKLPFLGNLSVIYATSLFTASLSTILAGGLPLNQALNISKGLIKNRVMQSKIIRAIEFIEQGKGFAQAFKEVDVFPDMALRMMAAGEEGGNLEKILKDIARFYEKDVEASLSILTSTIEPVLMVLMGFIIGFIMLAMYMPIFQMAGALG